MCSMTFRWTEHRFAGGALALDVANSVILRSDAVKSVDRFAVPAQIAAFAEAATRLGAERDRFPTLIAPEAEKQAVERKVAEARRVASRALAAVEKLPMPRVVDEKK